MMTEIGLLLKKMLEAGASDLHIGAGMVPALRLQNKIAPIPGLSPLQSTETESMIFSLLTQEQQALLHQNRELNASMSIPGAGRFRINVHRERGNWAAVFRRISQEIPSLDQLGMPEIVRALVLKESGLILAAGPTGSGTSTTVAAMVESINRSRECHIITIEDLIEVVFKNQKSIIKQREVGTDTASHMAALMNSFRQDPDVIVIGEMSDPEVVSAAVSAAGTGRLIIGVSHSVDAPGAIDGLIEIFPPNHQSLVRSQLAACLEGVICQQLPLKADKSGRILAVEVLITTPSVRNLIRTGKTAQITADMEAGKRFGMQTMNQSLQQLVAAGHIKLEEALRHTRTPEVFMEKLGVPRSA